MSVGVSRDRTYPGFDANGNRIAPGTPTPTGNITSGNSIPQPTINNQYPASIQKSNDDYSGLMKQYQDLYGQATTPNNPQDQLATQFQNLYNTPAIQFNPITPTTTAYTPTADTTAALGNLKDLASNGGYTQQGIADLRERGISPIRSVYASAQQNIDRAKRLQGGYSPNYTAATAKLTKGLSDSIASQETNVNAGIAQNVAQNKLGIAPSYASAAGNDQAARDATDKNNASILNSTAQFNSTGATQAQQFDTNSKQSILSSLQQLYNSGTGNKLAILDSIRQLYGTTPAQPALYGQQAATQTGLDLRNKEINNNASSTLINSYRS